jgi:hypothetical protein
MEFLYPQIDWLDVPWTGGYDEEEEFCDCELCQHIFLPLYGPLNKDGEPLGFLIAMS